MYLNCKTGYHTRNGNFSPAGLVNRAVEAGITALALTNINNTSDALDFLKYCKESKVKPILGAEIRNAGELLYILIATGIKGFEWINRFLSSYLSSAADFPVTTAETHFFEDPDDGFVIYPLGKKKLQDLLFNERIGIRPGEIDKLFEMDYSGAAAKLVMLQPVMHGESTHDLTHFHLDRSDSNIIGSNNSEPVTDYADQLFIPEMELIRRCKSFSFIIINTYKLMDACNISFELGKPRNKKDFRRFYRSIPAS